MNYIEITCKDEHFKQLSLENILMELRKYSYDYIWSLQFLWAVGDIEEIFGMNMLALEAYCKNSNNGLIISFEKLLRFSIKSDDIIDILIVGCIDENLIPKAYSTKDWEDYCDVIISKEDSSIWELYAKQSELMEIFRSLK